MSYGIEIRNNSTNHIIIDETYDQLQVNEFLTVTSTNNINDVPFISWMGTTAYELGQFVPIEDGASIEDIWMAPESTSFIGSFHLVVVTKLNAAEYSAPDPYPSVPADTKMAWVYNSAGTYTFRLAVTKDPHLLNGSAYTENANYGINIYNSANQLSYTTRARPTKYVDFFIQNVGFNVTTLYPFNNLPSSTTEPLFVNGLGTLINWVYGSIKYGFNAFNPRYVWNGVTKTISVQWYSYNGTQFNLGYDNRSDKLYAVSTFGQLGWNNWS